MSKNARSFIGLPFFNGGLSIRQLGARRVKRKSSAKSPLKDYGTNNIKRTYKHNKKIYKTKKKRVKIIVKII